MNWDQMIGLSLIGWAGLALLMIVFWWIQTRTRNAAIVDMGWALGIGLLAVFYALRGDGAVERRVLLGLAGGGWSLRLSVHLFIDRVFRVTVEEGRYETLRAKWGQKAHWCFFWFFQAQSFLAVVLALPFLLGCFDDRPLGVFDLLAPILILVSLTGETIADRQLKRFKANSANRGKTCQIGLWRYSRHPNYFFEWLIWVGFALPALSGPYGAAALISPFVIFHLIVHVTGIPPTEAQALRTRGDDYRAYQRTTNAFFPWFPRKRIF